MQSPQISTGWATQLGASAPSGSLQSARPSPSSSLPFEQSSGGFVLQRGIGVATQAPATQASAVQASPSLQSASTRHAVQVGSIVTAQAPDSQRSTVQA